MIGIYFTGTGNTEHCVTTFVRFVIDVFLSAQKKPLHF